MNYNLAKHLIEKTRFRVSYLGSRSGSGSIFIGNGSADPDPDPDPYQNEMDPQHCSKDCNINLVSIPSPLVSLSEEMSSYFGT